MSRHHTRFVPVKLEDCNAKGNPKPGMVVDKDIVSDYYYDFYLSAHFGALGESPYSIGNLLIRLAVPVINRFSFSSRHHPTDSLHCLA